MTAFETWKDPAMPQQVGKRLPNCTTKPWPNTGHYGFIDAAHWKEFFASLV